MSSAAPCRDRLPERMRSIWETERTGKACVRASSALGSRGENILPPDLQDGCPSPENNPTASAHAFLELFPFCTTAAAIWRLGKRVRRMMRRMFVDLYVEYRESCFGATGLSV